MTSDVVDLPALRGWLAAQQAAGQARSTLQRRAAAVRVFFAWAADAGRVSRDVAAALRSPRPQRSLPPTLARSEAARMLAGLPAPIKVIWRLAGRRKYDRFMADVRG